MKWLGFVWEFCNAANEEKLSLVERKNWIGGENAIGLQILCVGSLPM